LKQKQEKEKIHHTGQAEKVPKEIQNHIQIKLEKNGLTRKEYYINTRIK
jgi:hypothetical protein